MGHNAEQMQRTGLFRAGAQNGQARLARLCHPAVREGVACRLQCRGNLGRVEHCWWTVSAHLGSSHDRQTDRAETETLQPARQSDAVDLLVLGTGLLDHAVDSAEEEYRGE